MKHMAFLGDGERTFELTPDMALELERKTGVPIGVLFQRMRSQTFAFNDAPEIIRLALIGGGTPAKEAHDLVETYVRRRPLVESVPLAFEIMLALWEGEPANQDAANG